VKITPINFIAHLEPELIKFWKQRERVPTSSLELQRSHNFKLQRTALSLFKTTGPDAGSILCHIELSNIPQQQNNAALNCLLHLPGIESSHQLLMVFKSGDECSYWVKKIIQRTEQMLAERQNQQEGSSPP
jgi:hypothetical protein